MIFFRVYMFKSVRYSCAVLLIVTSVIMVFIELFKIDDVPSGLLYYIAQAFLLAGSIFGLDFYVAKLTNLIKK